MEFRRLVKYSVMVKRYGYYTVRCKMLKEGGSLEDVAKVLAFQLRILAE